MGAGAHPPRIVWGLFHCEKSCLWHVIVFRLFLLYVDPWGECIATNQGCQAHPEKFWPMSITRLSGAERWPDPFARYRSGVKRFAWRSEVLPIVSTQSGPARWKNSRRHSDFGHWYLRNPKLGWQISHIFRRYWNFSLATIACKFFEPIYQILLIFIWR